MKAGSKLLRVLLLAGIFAAAASFVGISAARRTPAPQAESVSITLLGTTDTHGRLLPWDYYADKPDDLGIAKIATLIKHERADAPDALLVDCGDTIQGTFFSNYFTDTDITRPNPMIAVFNLLRYDAMTAGNHEFNIGEEAMWKAKGESKFPWLGANIKQTYTQGVSYFPPYIIKNVKGVRVGIVGFTMPFLPPWKIEADYRGYELEPIVETAKRVIPEVRPKVDLLVLALHSGFHDDPLGKEPARPRQEIGENVAPEVAEQVPGIDVIFFGHSHSELPEKFVNGVLMTQPRNFGMSLARADVAMTRNTDGRWEVTSKHAHTIPVTDQVPADPDVMKLVKPYQEALEKYLDTPIATSAKDLSGNHAAYEDNPLLDVIQESLLDAGHADVAVTTIANAGARISAGPVTPRQVGALYNYSNGICVLQMTGAQLKDALEHSASFFSQWPLPPGETAKLPGYKADQAHGVSYEVDLTRPVGTRIRELQFHGEPLDPAQVLRVAVTSSRYSGEGRYPGYLALPVISRSPIEIRDLLIDHVKRTKTIPAEAAQNWKIVPPEAVAAMEKAADAEASSQVR
jgi:2',3'-cyclic-nucleotide 2'-phosphodiesterase/3'-nucleotidase